MFMSESVTKCGIGCIEVPAGALITGMCYFSLQMLIASGASEQAGTQVAAQCHANIPVLST